jgi:hypothetical protein
VLRFKIEKAIFLLPLGILILAGIIMFCSQKKADGLFVINHGEKSSVNYHEMREILIRDLCVGEDRILNQAVSEKELNKLGQNEILIKWKYADNQPIEISGVGMAVPNTVYVVLDEEKDWLICYVNDIHVVLYLKQHEVDELLNCL